jgi:hypothetical protein
MHFTPRNKSSESRRNRVRTQWLKIAAFAAVAVTIIVALILFAINERKRLLRQIAEVTQKLDDANAALTAANIKLLEAQTALRVLQDSVGQNNKHSELSNSILALEAQINALIRDRNEAQNVTRELTHQLVQLVDKVLVRIKVNGGINNAKTLLAKSEVAVNKILDLSDYCGSSPPGRTWNFHKNNVCDSEILRNPPCALRLHYQLDQDFSGWTLILVGDDWSRYKSGWELVLRLGAGNTCRQFKLDLNTDVHREPGFACQVEVNGQSNRIAIPLERLKLSDGTSSVTEGDHLRRVRDLAIVFEQKFSGEGYLVIESIRFEPTNLVAMEQ